MLYSTLATLAAVGLAAATPITPSLQSSQDGPDPSSVYVENISYGGTGCPAGSVSQQFSDDRKVFTLIMDNYVASIGPGVARTENRKNCQLNIKIHYPAGFSYSLFDATYRGYASLDAGVTGTQQSTYYFSGQKGQCVLQSPMKGPLEKNYEYTDSADTAAMVWSQCGAQGLLNINSEVRLTSTNPKATGLLTTDSVDGSFKTIIGFQWRKCT